MTKTYTKSNNYLKRVAGYKEKLMQTMLEYIMLYNKVMTERQEEREGGLVSGVEGWFCRSRMWKQTRFVDIYTQREKKEETPTSYCIFCQGTPSLTWEMELLWFDEGSFRKRVFQINSRVCTYTAKI